MPYGSSSGIAPLVVNATTGAISGWSTGTGLTLHGGGTVTGASGSLDLTASGTAGVTIAGAGSATLGLLRLPSGTTLAQGIALGDLNIYRVSATIFALNTPATSILLGFRVGDVRKAYILQSGVTTQIADESGELQLLSNGTVAVNFSSAQDVLFTPTNRVRIAGTKVLSFGATANARMGVTADTTAGDVAFNGTSTGIFTFDKAIRGNGGFQGSDGSAGLTQASTATLGRSITVVNGLVTAFA